MQDSRSGSLEPQAGRLINIGAWVRRQLWRKLSVYAIDRVLRNIVLLVPLHILVDDHM